jgi:hypothetical protein
METKNMNKKIIISLAGIVFFAIVVCVISFSGKENVLKGRTDGGSAAGVVVEKAQTGTTTPAYFTAGTTASSTKEIDIDTVSRVAPSVCLTASTTATVFNWTVDVADGNLSKNTTWFGKRDFTETSNLIRTWGATNIYNTWTPANSSSSTTCAQLFDMEDVIGLRAKITYNLTGANGAVFFETMAK